MESKDETFVILKKAIIRPRSDKLSFLYFDLYIINQLSSDCELCGTCVDPNSMISDDREKSEGG